MLQTGYFMGYFMHYTHIVVLAFTPFTFLKLLVANGLEVKGLFH